MARRGKGRRLDGWILVDKPAGPGSTDIVNRLKHILGPARIGHAGTLDPAATGLLVIALGEATKAIPFVMDAAKTYRFAVRLGAATTTDDAEGEVIATSPLRPGREAIEAALRAFRGDIMQVPPAFSAVKVDGERAYVAARAGAAPALAARPLRVERLDLMRHEPPDLAELEMVCGKGGYVRSIARDLGQSLGCLGHVLWLRRLATGVFGLDGALDGDRIAAVHAMPPGEERQRALDDFVLPLEAALAQLPRLELDDTAVARIGQGQAVAAAGFTAARGETMTAWASRAGQALAFGQVELGMFRPTRVLNRAAPR